MVASEHEEVISDTMVPGKGLIGDDLPPVLTLITEQLFSAFDGSKPDRKAIAYGHGYSGNIGQLINRAAGRRVSIMKICQSSDASGRKDAEEITA